jgi:uncharacterized protein (DUF2141 family)
VCLVARHNYLMIRIHSLAIIAAMTFSTLWVSTALGQDTQPAPGKPAQGCTLRIHVDGLRNSTGNIGTVLFTSAAGWPEDLGKTFRHGPAPIGPGERKGTAVWENLPPGDYAVAVIHDENSNHHLDRNFFGIPKEGFGFANNPRVVLSAPAFKLALVHVQCPETETTVHIQYK